MRELLLFSQEMSVIYTLFQNGRNFSILLFTCKLALVASFKGNILLNFEFKNEATRANLQENKRILKWRPFWNTVYWLIGWLYLNCGSYYNAIQTETNSVGINQATLCGYLCFHS